jgi:serine phosphatase RsbU (regulator of sigma subunit)
VLAGVPDAQMLPTLARLLRAEQDSQARYVTVCDLTVGAGRVTVRVAGHPAPIVCADGAPRYPELAVGPPLGVQPTGAPAWPDTELPAPPGTSVLLYTDGLLDAYTADAESASLGITELLAALGACMRAGGAARTWIPSLVGSAPRESIDDTAVVVLTVAAAE